MARNKSADQVAELECRCVRLLVSRLFHHEIPFERILEVLRLERVREASETSTRPQEVRANGMQAYPLAVSKELGSGIGGRGRYGRGNPHRRVPSIRPTESNSRIERLPRIEKARIRPMRGFDTDGGVAAIADGYRVHYDAVRTHLAIGTTPAEAAGLHLSDGFRWKEILERAVTRNVTPEASGQMEAKSPD